MTDNFDLHLIYPSGGAYLGQPTATINSTVFREGDLVLNHANGTCHNNSGLSFST